MQIYLNTFVPDKLIDFKYLQYLPIDSIALFVINEQQLIFNKVNFEQFFANISTHKSSVFKHLLNKTIRKNLHELAMFTSVFDPTNSFELRSNFIKFLQFIIA